MAKVSEWMVAIGVFLFSSGISLLTFRRISVHFRNLAILRPIRRPLRGFLLVCCLLFALQFAPDEIRDHPTFQHLSRIVFLFLGAWLIDRLMMAYLRQAELPFRLSVSTRALLSTMARVGLFAMVGLIVLDTLGISVTPLLASLGVGSVAVALALQDTFGNFFSGLYLLLDEPIRVGDYIKTESGVEGRVKKIGWRSTRLLGPLNNAVVIPNSKLSSATLTNFDLEDPTTIVQLELSLGFENDLDDAEETARQAILEFKSAHPEVRADWDPMIRYDCNADHGIRMAIAIPVDSFSQIGLMRHELLKKVMAHMQSRKLRFSSRCWNADRLEK